MFLRLRGTAPEEAAKNPMSPLGANPRTYPCFVSRKRHDGELPTLTSQHANTISLILTKFLVSTVFQANLPLVLLIAEAESGRLCNWRRSLELYEHVNRCLRSEERR